MSASKLELTCHFNLTDKSNLSGFNAASINLAELVHLPLEKKTYVHEVSCTMVSFTMGWTFFLPTKLIFFQFTINVVCTLL